MREEFIGTVVKLISGWDNLVAVEVNVNQRRIVTSYENLPTLPTPGQKAKIVKEYDEYWISDWWSE